MRLGEGRKKFVSKTALRKYLEMHDLKKYYRFAQVIETTLSFPPSAAGERD